MANSQAMLVNGETEERRAVGDFGFDASDFARIAGLMLERTGVYLPETKKALVYSRLSKRLRALSMRSFDQYCDFVESKAGAAEMSEMLSALTTNVTRFFREPHHFDHLRENVIRPLLNSTGRLRIWSAGCSTGEEPYTIAMCILSEAPDAAQRDIKVLATDVNPAVVGRAREGIYAAEDVDGVEREMRSLGFKSAPDGPNGKKWVVVNDAVKSLVSFREHNLNAAWPMSGPFDAIFCRNVVIYFQEETRRKIWMNFSDRLSSEGRLYIGHSERVSGDAMGRFSSDGVTTYRMQGKPARRAS